MTEITIYRDENDIPFGFECSGHAGFKRSGKDIVCAAISMLTINFVNSVDEFTDSAIEVESDEKSGYLKATIKEYNDSKVELLFNSLLLGLSSIQEDYSKFLKLTNRRCKP